MIRTTHLIAVGVAALSAMLALPAGAEDVAYSYGTVWEIDYMRTEPGQFENYLDYLDREFKRQCEFGKQEGVIVSCRVLTVNATRAGEPDLLLLTEYKDYLSTAQRKAFQDKFAALIKRDMRKLTTEFGERKVLRTPMGSVEAQELNLK